MKAKVTDPNRRDYDCKHLQAVIRNQAKALLLQCKKEHKVPIQLLIISGFPGKKYSLMLTKNAVKFEYGFK